MHNESKEYKINRILAFGHENFKPADKNEKTELRAFKNLRKRLINTSSILYFKPIIPLNGKLIKPDILWIHPQVGILVIEVKAWDKNFIRNGEWKEDGKFYGKNDSYGSNPIQEANNFVEKINRKIQKIPEFKKQDLPISFIIYFPNLTEREYDSSTDEIFKNMVPKEFCLFRGETNLIEKLVSRLREYNYVNFNKIISEKEFEPIRKALFPHLSISKINITVSEEDIPVLDIYQENLLHGHWKGYRILRGTAGSGKTVVLIGKAIYEKLKNPDKKILIVSFANSLINDIKTSIEQIINLRKLDISIDDFHIKTVDSLITDLYIKYVNEFDDASEQANILIEKIKENPDIIEESDKYDVILCDESQDLKKDVFQIIKALSKDNTLVIFGVDETQRIYDERDWKWTDVGYNAKGRVTVLKRSYRNPGNILKTAVSLLKKDSVLIEELRELEAAVVSDDILPMREDGEEVEFYIANNEFTKVKEIVENLIKNNVKPEDIFILSPTANVLGYYEIALKSILPEDKIHSFSSYSEKGMKYIPKDKLVIMPYKSAKGLERPVVIVTGVHMLPYKQSKTAKDKKRDRKTLYVALTRAQRKLIITAQKEEGFAVDLKEILM
ncbi:Superfamily I DNA and RNA helicases [Persephonella hydrogeniphila]|uniref:DNA 3'-5' helicase II n=1 Tax=Persephonella hydrogeniphila TaxID=198703 RepID=A0A285NJ48_9AQUI|nr:UvrD-helicase domain-containing protein [Persephonella hydrogeniphila]SNZ07681.1 Superfamily I DNA and RNA helicases [Persephonella hydrogeniphila]